MNQNLDKGETETYTIKPDDNWEWPTQTIDKIRRWAK
jgi:hypothetical protein